MKNMNMSNSDTDQAFQCANNSNFQMDINGFRISIFFGPGAHITDQNIKFHTKHDAPMNHQIWGTNSAEVLVWDRKGDPIKWDNNNTVIGRCSSDLVARFIGFLSMCPPVNFDPTEGLRKILNAQ